MFRSNITRELEVRTHQAELLTQAARQRCIAELKPAATRRTWRFWRTFSLRPAATA